MNVEKITIKQYFEFDKRLYFLVLCFLNLFFTFLFKELIFTDDLYYEVLGEQLSYDRIEALIQNNKQYGWFNYVISPVFLILKIFLVSLCLFTGVIFFEYKLSFKKVFQIALIAEAIYLIPVCVKAIWFLFIVDNYNYNELVSFDFYSLLAVFGRENVEAWWAYVLYCINFFELFYWLALAYGFYLALPDINYDQALELVLSSYGTGLLLWIIFICFLLVSMT